MAQILSVVVFFWLLFTGCYEAVTSGALGRVPLVVLFAWSIAFVGRVIATLSINIIDRKLQYSAPFISEMNVQKASQRAYEAIHKKKNTGYRADTIEFTIYRSSDVMHWLLFLAPWEMFYREYGETMTCRVEFTHHPEMDGTIVFMSFATNCVPSAIRFFSVLDRIELVGTVKKALKARPAPGIPRNSFFAQAERDYDCAQDAHANRDYPLALDLIRKAIEIRSHNGNYWNQLGLTLVAMEHYEEARTAYEHAAEIEPGEGCYFANIGYTYYYEGDYLNAYKFVDHANKLGFNSSYATEVLIASQRALRG